MPLHNILIAEDDQALRDLYMLKLGTDKFTIRTAENGEVALRMIAEQKPDVLLLDLNMPVLDGFGVLEKLPPKGQRGLPFTSNLIGISGRCRG